MAVTDSTSPQERLSISQLQPAAYSALVAFDRAAKDGLRYQLVESCCHQQPHGAGAVTLTRRADGRWSARMGIAASSPCR
jgi:hypothetical protein